MAFLSGSRSSGSPYWMPKSSQNRCGRTNKQHGMSVSGGRVSVSLTYSAKCLTIFMMSLICFLWESSLFFCMICMEFSRFSCEVIVFNFKKDEILIGDRLIDRIDYNDF